MESWRRGFISAPKLRNLGIIGSINIVQLGQRESEFRRKSVLLRQVFAKIRNVHQRRGLAEGVEQGQRLENVVFFCLAVASIAGLSEGVVVVVADQADPVASSVLRGFAGSKAKTRLEVFGVSGKGDAMEESSVSLHYRPTV